MKDAFQYIAGLTPEQKRALLAQLLEKKEANVPWIYPLSHGQQALWFLHQLAPESGAYNEALIWRIRQEIHVPALQHAWQHLVQRHPVLRTVYVLQGDKPVQKVLESSPEHFTLTDAGGWSQEQLREFLNREVYQPIDLERGPVFRVHLLSLTPQEYLLLLIAHHIAIDLWSFMVLLDEMAQIYTAVKNDQPVQLPDPRVSYRDYVRWQAEMLAGPEGDELWSYWQKQLNEPPPPLQLPVDHPRPAVQTFVGTTHAFALSKQVSQQLKRLAKSQGVTLYTLLLAAFQVLLYRYSGQEDILVNSPTNGRSQLRFDGVVGYFVNPVAIRGRIGGNPSFTNFLHQIQQTVIEALQHQDYPFPLLVDRLQPHRDPGRSPLCDVAFVMEQPNRYTFSLNAYDYKKSGIYTEGMTGAYLRVGELALELVNVERRAAKFDLELGIVSTGDILAGSLQYNRDLFDEATIAGMARHFQTLLQSILANPDQGIEELPILPHYERQHLLKRWSATSSQCPADVCLHTLIERQAAQTPDMPAVIFDQQILTYHELDRRANQLAHYLRALGIRPESRVGLYLDRSLEFVIGLLGVLKAGGAYVPMDPTYPRDRLHFMIEDASLQVILTQQHLKDDLFSRDIPIVALDADWPAIAQQPDSWPAGETLPENLAYVIYTSGSTGRPKGVMIQHRSLVNYIIQMQQLLEWRAGWHFAVVSTPSADLGNTSIFGALTSGGCLHVFSYQSATDGKAFAQYMLQHPIDVLKIVPSHMRSLLVEGKEILPRRVLLLGGEALPRTLIEQIQKMNAECVIVNHYGPAETTIGVMINNLGNRDQWDHLHTKGLTTTVGLNQPLGNTQVYVLDRHLEPVPAGVPGELYIGGHGLARGYTHRPDLSAERFICHPFTTEPGKRLYKTGDLVRYHRDGDIEFLGRTDRQIKVRGFRIELEEIERGLRRHPAIETALVLASGDLTDRRLIAYLVAQKQQLPPSTSELHRWLREQLPDYMIPATFIYIDVLPLNANGKLDLLALPAPNQKRPALEMSYVAPRTEVEQAIAQAWQGVLDLEQVGIHDNFFELGGNSLLMYKVHHRLRAVLLRDIALVTLFRYPTVGSLADFISQQQQSSASQEGYDRASSRLAHQRRRHNERKRPVSQWYRGDTDAG